MMLGIPVQMAIGFGITLSLVVVTRVLVYFGCINDFVNTLVDPWTTFGIFCLAFTCSSYPHWLNPTKFVILAGGIVAAAIVATLVACNF